MRLKLAPRFHSLPPPPRQSAHTSDPGCEFPPRSGEPVARDCLERGDVEKGPRCSKTMNGHRAGR